MHLHLCAQVMDLHDRHQHPLRWYCRGGNVPGFSGLCTERGVTGDGPVDWGRRLSYQ